MFTEYLLKKKKKKKRFACFENLHLWDDCFWGDDEDEKTDTVPWLSINMNLQPGSDKHDLAQRLESEGNSYHDC